MSGVARVRVLPAMGALVLAATALAVEPPLAEVPQLWSSSGIQQYGETDSIAIATPLGGTAQVFVTAKKADCVHVFDARSGAWMRSLGSSGSAPGQFKRPNGIATLTPRAPGGGAVEPVLVVVERDNARVQVISLDGKSLAVFGAGLLVKPYGVAALVDSDGAARIFVTDVNPDPTRRIHLFTCKPAADAAQLFAQAPAHQAFGEPDGPGLIVTPESVAIDAKRRRLLLCDEDETQRSVKVYTLDGKFTGQVFASEQVKVEPEGILVLDGPKQDFIIVTDQQKTLSIWHLYDAESFRHLASFTGTPRIANTDGVAVLPAGGSGHPGGLFVAVNDDAAMCAYPLDAILKLADQSRPPK